MLGELVAHNGATVLQYCAGQGDERLRELICDVMALEGITGASSDDVVITVGSQQALDLVSRIFLDPGDVVLAEGPSYVGALGTFAAAEADRAARGARRARARPGRPRGDAGRAGRGGTAGEVPLHGAQLPQPGRGDAGDRAAGRDRRDLRAVRRADHRGQPVRAARLRRPDAAGAEVAGAGPGRLPRLVLQDVRLRRAGRLGVRAAGDPGQARAAVSESQVLCPPMLSQLAVAEYLSTQPWREQIKIFRELYRERRDAMLDALGALMPPGCTWTRPDGGFYVWLDPAGRARREGHAAARHRTSGSRTSPASASTPTARGSGRCGCRTATPRRSGSARGCGGWPAWSSRSWSCGRPSSAHVAVGGAGCARPRGS